MYLKKVEISGFKSFANKTTLDFLPARIATPARQPDGSHGGEQSVAGGIDFEKNRNCLGIAVIVGPNGSGKSNIADAIRWVMGEQSMKNLRGKKSEDVIFAGSGKKAKLGSAKATLFFDNSDKRFPLDFEEVTISRKVFRSGEGEYSINNSRVRLQDVVDMLAKAGIGKESYSIVNQGMADAILNATPLERRSLIEDAAGVKQYQIKKIRSIRKLDSTRENLDRARDLAEEIKPHLKMLKRQAEKAAQGKEIAERLKIKQNSLYSFLWQSFQKEKGELDAEKNVLGAKMMNVQREADKLTDEINKYSKEENKNQKLEELERKRAELKDALNKLDRDLIVTEGRIQIEKEKQESFQMMEEIKIKSVSVDLPYVKREIEGIRSEQEVLVQRIENAKSLEELQEIKNLAREISRKLNSLYSDVEKGRKEEPAQSPTGIVASRKVEPEIKVDQSVIIELEEKLKIIREEITKNETELKEIEKNIQEEIELDRQKRKDFFELERNLMLKQGELNKLKDEFNEAKISSARVEVREEDLKAEVLRELKIDTKDLPEAPAEIDRMDLERDITRLKVQTEQIGGIDPMVADEYQETSNRYEFLMNESQDLEKAIVSLKEIIKEMDSKIDDEFGRTFEEINKEFSKYFRIIFGGGNANLTKSKIRSQKSKAGNPEEIAGTGEEIGGSGEAEIEEEKEKEEIGIDIVATPPGKKISHLSMLSGGERSLTSLALLFAIISHNPPPFSILDEVEAALDEANSRRFGRILQELSNNTQFVIITHNRETMRQASLLYGVTMGEDGISKLLSVRLDQVGQGGKILSNTN